VKQIDNHIAVFPVHGIPTPGARQKRIELRRDWQYRFDSLLGRVRARWQFQIGKIRFPDGKRTMILGPRCDLIFDDRASIEVKQSQLHILSNDANNPYYPEASNLGVETYWRFLDHPTTRRTKIRLGEASKLILNPNTSLCTGVYISVWNGMSLEIGRGTYIGNDVFIASSLGMKIGEEGLIGLGTTIMDYDGHPIISDEKSPPLSLRGGNKRRVTIGDRVWIGFHCSILKGVTIGEGAIVGSHSVVTEDVPAHSIVAGNPARVIRTGVTWRD